MSRTRRSLYGFVASAGFSAVTLIGGLAVSPLLVGWLGAESFGAWRAWLELMAWLTLLDFGLRGSLAPLISRALAGGGGTLPAVLSVAGRSSRRAGALKALACIAAVPVIGWLIPVGPGLMGDLRTACVISAVGLAVSSLDYVRTLIECRQQPYVVIGLSLLQYVATTTIALLAAWAGAGITGQAVGALVGTVCFHAGLVAIELRRNTPLFVRTEPSRPDPAAQPATPDPNEDLNEDPATAAGETRRLGKELRSLQTPIFIRQLGGQMSLFSDSLIVAAMLDPAAVAGFFFTRRIAELIRGQVAALSSATWAGLGNLYHSGERETYRTRVLELTKLTAAMSVVGLVPTLLLNESFVVLWAGREYYSGSLVTAAAVAASFILPVTVVWDWCFQVTGSVRSLVPMSVAAAVLNLALSVGLTPLYGVAGPLLGTALSYAATGLWYEPVLMGRELGFSVRRLYAAVAAPLPAGAAAWLLGWWLLPQVPEWATTTWAGLIVCGGLTSLCCLTAVGLTAFNRAERRRWRDRILHAVRGRVA